MTCKRKDEEKLVLLAQVSLNIVLALVLFIHSCIFSNGFILDKEPTPGTLETRQGEFTLDLMPVYCRTPSAHIHSHIYYIYILKNKSNVDN